MVVVDGGVWLPARSCDVQYDLSRTNPVEGADVRNPKNYTPDLTFLGHDSEVGAGA